MDNWFNGLRWISMARPTRWTFPCLEHCKWICYSPSMWSIFSTTAFRSSSNGLQRSSHHLWILRPSVRLEKLPLAKSLIARLKANICFQKNARNPVACANQFLRWIVEPICQTGMAPSFPMALIVQCTFFDIDSVADESKAGSLSLWNGAIVYQQQRSWQRHSLDAVQWGFSLSLRTESSERQTAHVSDQRADDDSASPNVLLLSSCQCYSKKMHTRSRLAAGCDSNQLKQWKKKFHALSVALLQPPPSLPPLMHNSLFKWGVLLIFKEIINPADQK